MPINTCEEFVEVCGCGSRHLSVDAKDTLAPIEKAFDDHQWKLVGLVAHPNQATVENAQPKHRNWLAQQIINLLPFLNKWAEYPENKIDKNDQIYKLSILNDRYHTIEYEIDLSEQGCGCDVLLALIVNLELDPAVLSKLLRQLSLFKSCFTGYRSEKEMRALVNFLDTKDNTVEIIMFLTNTWNEANPN